MRYNVEALRGLVFTHPDTKGQYGKIRPSEVVDHPGAIHGADVFAEDDCGNAFLVSPSGAIEFWDHETDEKTELAPNWNAFSKHCHEPEPVELDESQVESVWIDPDFAQEHGLDVPRDGWKKKP